MGKNKLKKYIVALVLVLFTAAAWFGGKQAVAAVQRVQEITAYYTGDAVEVGDELNIKDFYVMAEYYIYDGYTESTDFAEIKKGFTISPTVIKNEGTNKIVVTYQGKTSIVEVEGKVVTEITADYLGEELYVGAPVPPGKIEVYAYFSDGSYERVRDFTLSITSVGKEGLNNIPVVYGGKMTYVYVYGKAPLAVQELIAYYDGDMLIEGNTIPKSSIKVEALYNDGSIKTITNFNISPSVAEDLGENEITVSYGDISTTIEVYAMERLIEDMTAKYTGPGVIVGKKAEREDFEVIVTYNDGSTDETDDFEIFGEEILYEGENVVLIYCDAFMADVVVFGVQGFAANYDNCLTNYFASEDYSAYTEVTLGMNMGLEADKFSLRVPADSAFVNRMVRRILPTEEYIAFELVYDDDEMVLEFPMAMKVTVPSDYDPELFGVYYSPNKSETMAKIDGDFIDEDKTEYEFIVYEPGMYVVMHELSEELVTSIIVEEELELKVNRNYSLNPVVFPTSADNKELSFESSDENVATVSENGKIRTHEAGECEILIEATDGSDVYIIVNVIVKEHR